MPGLSSLSLYVAAPLGAVRFLLVIHGKKNMVHGNLSC